MEAFIDNIWSTPSTLHFRIIVVTNANRRVFKQDWHVDLGDLDGVDLAHLIDAHGDPPDPTRDPAQVALW